MSIIYKFLPFIKTGLISNSWREQLNKGINFKFKDNSIFLVRDLCEKDIDRILKLEQKIFTDPWPKPAFQTEIENQESCLDIVGIIDNKIIAYAISQFVFDELHIYNLAVDSLYRGKGYGKTLVWLMLEIALRCDIKVCHLEVRRSNFSAISLYEQFGFQIVGIRKKYYIKENEDALLMTLLI